MHLNTGPLSTIRLMTFRFQTDEVPRTVDCVDETDVSENNIPQNIVPKINYMNINSRNIFTVYKLSTTGYIYMGSDKAKLNLWNLSFLALQGKTFILF